MKEICPLCNGLYEIDFQCTNCDTRMIDNGPVVNYLDNYSPYLVDEISKKTDGAPKDKCVHLFQCPFCNENKSFIIERKNF
jgi:hypothetical protein